MIIIITRRLYRGPVSPGRVPQRFVGSRSVSTVLVNVLRGRPQHRPSTQGDGNHCSECSRTVLVTFSTSDVSKQPLSSRLNHFRHWNMQRAEVNFHFGEVRCKKCALFSQSITIGRLPASSPGPWQASRTLLHA